LSKTISETEALEGLRQGREKALEWLFREYYAYLCQSVYRLIPDGSLAEDIAQEVYFELWRKRKVLVITTSARAYLRRSAVNKALNYLRDQRLPLDDEPLLLDQVESHQVNAGQRMEAEELQQQIDRAVEALPDRCRLVFVLSRFEEMANKEIADELGISVKTVENQMTKALRLLRESLGHLMGDG
jgi:RNA polymerase sigma-70 factor, ECF subfamily